MRRYNEIHNDQDYGHATALLRTLERNDEAAKAREQTAVLEASDFKCRQCGATMRVTRDVWPKESACEHGFSWNYGIVLTAARGSESDDG